MSECNYCNGNDNDKPCAYPSENKPGCLRDERLSASPGCSIAELNQHVEWIREEKIGLAGCLRTILSIRGEDEELVKIIEDALERENA